MLGPFQRLPQFFDRGAMYKLIALDQRRFDNSIGVFQKRVGVADQALVENFIDNASQNFIQVIPGHGNTDASLNFPATGITIGNLLPFDSNEREVESAGAEIVNEQSLGSGTAVRFHLHAAV